MALINNEKGLALPLAIIVMFVLSLLGTALWQYSTTNTKHVALDEARMQAYYVARSGAEAALQAWLDAPPGAKPSGTSDSVSFGPGSFRVRINAGTRTEGPFTFNIRSIESTGVVRNTERKAAVAIKLPLEGHQAPLNWYDFQNGSITSGVHAPVNGTVVLRARQRIRDPNAPTTYEANALFFESALGPPINRPLHLRAGTIVFYEPVRINTGGDVVLHLRDGQGVTREGRDGLWGRVYFANVRVNNQTLNISGRAYYFPPGGIRLTSAADRGRLELIGGGAPLPSTEEILWY